MELKINNLCKSYGNHEVVKDISLSLEKGIHALLGPNGSGKSTLIKMIAGVLASTSGNVDFHDYDIMKNYDAYVLNLGYLPQDFGVYMDFTVEEFLKYMCILKKLEKEYSKKKIDELLIRLNLNDVRKRKIRKLSGGMLQRVGIAQSLLNHPKILLLDEPSVGLDPKERIAFRQMLSIIAKDTIVILSTHIVSDVENIAEDVLIMKDGSIISRQSLKDTLKVVEGKVYESIIDNSVYDNWNQGVIVNVREESGRSVVRYLNEGEPTIEHREVAPTLEDVYLHYFAKENGYVESDLL